MSKQGKQRRRWRWRWRKNATAAARRARTRRGMRTAAAATTTVVWRAGGAEREPEKVREEMFAAKVGCGGGGEG